MMGHNDLDRYVCKECETVELSPVDVLPFGWQWVAVGGAFEEPICGPCERRRLKLRNHRLALQAIVELLDLDEGHLNECALLGELEQTSRNLRELLTGCPVKDGR